METCWRRQDIYLNGDSFIRDRDKLNAEIGDELKSSKKCTKELILVWRSRETLSKVWRIVSDKNLRGLIRKIMRASWAL